jgi:hypothetical protein
MYRDETIELMEPMLPVATREIEDLIFTLIQQASELNAVLKLCETRWSADRPG